MRWLYGVNLLFLLIVSTVMYTGVLSNPLLGNMTMNKDTWFESIKPYCNPVEVGMAIKRNPPPKQDKSQAYAAACYALAGKIDKAQQKLDGFPSGKRPWAANIVFNVAHPIADMGDDESAGPIMQLVVRYYPNHYMALYHAGISLYATGHTKDAKRHLTRFLELYKINDSWRKKAKSVLAKIRRNA